MAKSTASAKVSDPVLGRLTYDEFAWQAKVPGPAKRALTIELETDDESTPPSAAQLAAARRLVERQDGLVAIAQAVLWDYYERIVVKVYRAQMDPKKAALRTPHIEAPAEVWRLVSHPAIRISDDGKTLDLRLVGGCKWDEEHGIEIDLDADGKPRRR